MNPIIKAAEQMDWMQVVLNQGPPCFHLDPEDGRFCGRAERWDGHKTWEGSPRIHKFVSLADLLKPNAKLTEACKLVLLFHDGGEWTNDKRLAWSNTIGLLLQNEYGRVPKDFSEATTKNLCNAVRAALATIT